MDLLFFRYNAIADIITFAICTINLFLLHSAYIEKNENLKLFHTANLLNAVAAITGILSFWGGSLFPDRFIWLLYPLGMIRYISLGTNMAIFAIYLRNVSHMTGKNRNRITRFVKIALSMFVVAQIIIPWTPIGDWFVARGRQRYECLYLAFAFFYVLSAWLIIMILRCNWRHFITKVRRCIIQVMFLSFLTMFVETIFHQRAFSTVTFSFPVIAALFLFHYNPYDAATGTLDSNAFDTYVRDMKQKQFGMICMYLRDVSLNKIEPLKEHFFHFNEKYFEDSCTFRFSMDKLIMAYPIAKNPDREKEMKKVSTEFQQLYQIHQIDYKLIRLDSMEEMMGGAQYLGLLDLIASEMNWNSYHTCTAEDVSKYKRQALIELALQDIMNGQDLNDDRVRVFCQPVLNTRTGKFTTAEALMRIVLPKEGMLYPDEFIPVAEKNEYIHFLSKIILNKTCKEIVRLQKEGFEIERVSINFAMTELRNPNFSNDVISIIQNNHLELGKIAIELTESRNEEDFELVKKIMHYLHSVGIKFYLDDFGTGYSNFARIIGLPFDIIKFDRSMTILANQDEQSKYMVGSFSNIFDRSNYQVLFEGVENEGDEERCEAMNAIYLQGYKYSKPIPIEELNRFLEKTASE